MTIDGWRFHRTTCRSPQIPLGPPHNAVYHPLSSLLESAHSSRRPTTYRPYHIISYHIISYHIISYHIMQRPDRSLPPAPIEDSSPTTPTATTINRGWFSSFKLMATKPAISKTWTKKGKEPVSPGVVGTTGQGGGTVEHETGTGQREDRDHRTSE
jgi:hypothetical protein